MSNVALGKSVEEPINNAIAATDGVVTGYTGMRGFTEFPWPGTLTVDLGQTHAARRFAFCFLLGRSWQGRPTRQSNLLLSPFGVRRPT